MTLSNEIQPLRNPNIEWAQIFVDELARGGLTAVCLAPGSRSTPLTLAFHAHPAISTYLHLDERSAAFFALGMALADEKPVALLCTSGTAAANFHPAIIEAQMSQVPLLVLTADRPPELRHSGANQTIDQVKMYGDHVLWSVDVALPQSGAPRGALRNLRTLAARALFHANGLVKGPIHLNFPFRKPLEPADPDDRPVLADEKALGRPFSQITIGDLQPTISQLEWMKDILEKHPKGIIICGPRRPSDDFPLSISQLAKATGYPILADPLSGVRFGPHTRNSLVLGSYETFLQSEQSPWLTPEVILRFGSVPTSKWLNNYLNRINPTYHIHIRGSGPWADQNHRTSHFLQANAVRCCQFIADSINCQTDHSWIKLWSQAESTCWSIIEDSLNKITFDGSFVAEMLSLIPSDASLFVGNSLAIRHVDQFGRPREKSLRVFANRGASGIDGNISTGLGVAVNSKDPTILLVGDITFYHDSNGLLAIKKMGLENVIIVLLNNNGGGIFRRLPVAQIEPPFEDLFLTPHSLDFAPLAAAYGLKHHLAGDRDSFRTAMTSALAGSTPAIIEVRTDSWQDDKVRRQIELKVFRSITRAYHQP